MLQSIMIVLEGQVFCWTANKESEATLMMIKTD